MGDTCASCRHFDQDSTELPICVLHRKSVNSGWTCGDLERRGGGAEKEAANQRG